MLYLAFIFHMHQPYYKNLITQEAPLPWVRLHGVKDYLDMALILEDYPLIRQTFNFVPSLLEQLEDISCGTVKERFFELSYRPAKDLTSNEKEFLLEKFFSINVEKVISIIPRYYELYFKRQAKKSFNIQDFLDLQLLFNLSWIDPYFRQRIPALQKILNKARFFSEEDKRVVLDTHKEIIKDIIPSYKKFIESGQIELTLSPYYHPILPLLCNTNIAKEANPKAILPKANFSYPKDAQKQIEEAVQFFNSKLGIAPCGMWPSEESVSEHILPFIINAGINWIVADEAVLFKSLKKKKRDAAILYQPHLLRREEGNLNIVFRDRNLSDLIGFVYHKWSAKEAVADFMEHLENIAKAFSRQETEIEAGSRKAGKDKDILVTVAMDGENAWEYYTNDGHDFLTALYQNLSDSKIVKTTTISGYLKTHPAKSEIKRLAAGSWINGDFGKWIGNPHKVKAWQWLAEAREELGRNNELAWKQIYILEGSDWFWWYGEEPDGDFDRLFRMHLKNFYNLINKEPPEYLNKPLTT